MPDLSGLAHWQLTMYRNLMIDYVSRDLDTSQMLDDLEQCLAGALAQISISLQARGATLADPPDEHELHHVGQLEVFATAWNSILRMSQRGALGSISE